MILINKINTFVILQTSAHCLTMEAVSSLVSVFLVKVIPSFVASVWLDLFLTLLPVMPARALVSQKLFAWLHVVLVWLL